MSKVLNENKHLHVCKKRKMITNFFLIQPFSKSILANSEQGVEVDVFGYKNEEEQAFDLDLDAGLIEVGPLGKFFQRDEHRYSNYASYAA